MSKSYNNAIFFADTKEEVQQKVMRFFTDPQKLRKGDPGRPEICPVFSYHKIFSPQEDVNSIEEDCRSGALGCVECKRLMFLKLEEYLEPIREKRRDIQSRIDELVDIFEEGSRKAQSIAKETMEEVRKKMNLV